MTPLPWRICFGFVACLLLTGRSAAQDAAPPPATASATNGERASLPRIPGFFEIDLPKTELPGIIKLSFLPHFSDLLHESYLRVPLELRWGVNDHFELNTAADTYFGHGLRNGPDGYGLSALHFGAKYASIERLRPTWDTSVGFNTSFPVSRPPIDMTDGYNHFTPYIVFGRKLAWTPGLSGFIHASVDLISKSSTPGIFGRNQPHSNSLTLTPGLLYDRQAWHYTLEVDCTTTSVVGQDNQDFVTIRPGVIWDLPKKLVFNAHGRWLAGINLTATFGPDGNTIGTGGKFRGEINLTRLFGRNRQPSGSPPPIGY